MRRRNIAPVTFAASALAVCMVLGSGIGTAWAYFTTNTDATGGHALSLVSEETNVDEEFNFNDWTKRVTVTNTDTSGRPVYVRARAYSGSQYTLEYPGSAENGWNLNAEDGYWYYNGIVEIGGQTAPLNVEIKNVPEDIKDADAFNVVVVYETTPVQYDSQGNPYADWSLKLNVTEPGSGETDNQEGTEEGGNS